MDHRPREHVLALLDDYPAKTSEEVWAREQTRSFVETHHNFLRREDLAGHLTGSAFVVEPSVRRMIAKVLDVD